tara:strand:- start:3799 stop:4950 length:1152 start_codon:yes stop_codon:yes gene_type:complete
MGIQRDRGWGFQQRRTSQSTSDYINSERDTKQFIGSNRRSGGNRNGNKFLRLLRLLQPKQLYDNKSRRSVSIHSELPRTWHDKPDYNPESNYRGKRNRHNFNVYAVSTLVLSIISPTAALAENVGGVSATANPIANSSGSVTNQAIQVLQGPYITNTYGGGVQCQGATINFTPYLQFADSRKDPWRDFVMEPQYNTTDFTGRITQQTVTVKNYPWESWYDTRTKDDGTRWFPDGEDMEITIDVDGPDGIPDNPGQVIWEKPVRTDMTANQSLNLGLSATLSIPLNRKLQKQCMEAAQLQNDMQGQLIANKRLDFELARLKNCGELKKNGIFFHPKSPYYSVCADVVVTNPGGQLLPHTHEMPKPNWDEKPNGTAEDLGTFEIP